MHTFQPLILHYYVSQLSLKYQKMWRIHILDKFCRKIDSMDKVDPMEQLTSQVDSYKCFANMVKSILDVIVQREVPGNLPLSHLTKISKLKKKKRFKREENCFCLEGGEDREN